MYLDRITTRRIRQRRLPAAYALAQGAAALLLLSCADRLIVRRPFLGRAFWAAFDVLVHGAVALVVARPCIRQARGRKRALALSGLTFAAATALDVDHFVSAGSLDLGPALALVDRPPTHSLTFALAVGAAVRLASRDREASWVALTGIASHVLRDAAMGTAPLLWPLSIDAVPRWAYVCGELGLLLASGAFWSGARRHAGKRDRRLILRRPVSAP
jgi:hypothetical protein